ncbi:hypothetical protein FNV43_RR18182 [Rhamnella rubrinervis]|uniref:Uncharacterized protein n=1 Tax=Rhamnella rubrinervis TaxID=2594499 RepID=A0A8K0E5C2_9ROSA|nr:hypothetical protein FNV43_RR18182 [Rhamnella rubrinervis]
MELNKEEVQSLVERAWSLHGRLNVEIKNSIRLCRFCPDYGRNFDLTETPFDERERLIAISDSMKEVEEILMFLQRLSSRQVSERHSALTLLEESRLILIEMVTQYQGRALDVVRELNECFGNENAERLKKNDEPNVENKRFLSGCNVRKLFFIPWKWENVVGIAVRFFLVSASISSMLPVYRISRHLLTSSGGKVGSLFVDTSRGPRNTPLDVLYARG